MSQLHEATFAGTIHLVPNSQVHLFVGALSAGGYAYLSNPSDDPLNRLSSCLGSIVGGLLTAKLPDRIDPPVGYSHRSIGHSFILNALALGLTIPKLKKLIQQFQEKAEQASNVGDMQQSSKWHFYAGLLAGLVIGLGSHLLLDACTPMGLPW
jgi:membrane-bound metal-dependent hydrolase YbcI (DUF457 family)